MASKYSFVEPGEVVYCKWCDKSPDDCDCVFCAECRQGNLPDNINESGVCDFCNGKY